MPPELTVIVVQVGPAAWAPLCSVHGPESTAFGSPQFAAYAVIGHVAAYHTTRRAHPQEHR